MSQRFNLICATATLLLTGSLSSAAVVTNLVNLSGGDAGEGFTPPTNVVAIEDFGGVNTPGLAVQGLTFPTTAANITTTAAYNDGTNGGNGTFDDSAFHPSFYDPASSAVNNDQNLTKILQDGITNNGNAFTVTVSGLNPGEAYRVESLFGSSVGRTLNVTFNGADTTTTPLTRTDEGYDLVADGVVAVDGTITIGYNPGPAGGFNTYSYVNAVVVSSTPEPTELGLLGIGASGLLVRRRRSC